MQAMLPSFVFSTFFIISQKLLSCCFLFLFLYIMWRCFDSTSRAYAVVILRPVPYIVYRVGDLTPLRSALPQVFFSSAKGGSACQIYFMTLNKPGMANW